MGVMRRVGIQYPDDIDHHYAVLRAWDRHLISVGLLPISTTDYRKVGPILVNPNGSGEHFTYGFSPSGHLIFWTETLLASRV